MTKTVEKIAAGITTAPYDGPAASDDALAGELLSLTEIGELASLADSRATRFDSDLNALSDLSKLESEIDERWNRVSHLSAADRRKNAATELAARRREILQASSEKRTTAIRELMALGRRADAALKFYSSPVMLLAREGLGSPERSRYAADVANAGPAELRQFAAMAAATGNRVLGAAIHARLNGMPAQQRKSVGVSSQALAERLVGEDHKRAVAHLEGIRLKVAKAVNRNREVESGARSAFRKLALAVRGQGIPKIDPHDAGE